MNDEISFDDDAPARTVPLEAREIKQFSTVEAAKQLGIHRVTLLRMEQTGKIPPATWTRRPQPHRVYSYDDIERIRHAIYHDASGRRYVDEQEGKDG